MRCPRCNQLGFQPFKDCSNCRFTLPPKQEEALHRINWLLAEIDGWEWLDAESQIIIRKKYLDRKKKLELDIGLRLQPFTKKEAKQARQTLRQHETLFQKLGQWLGKGHLNPVVSEPMVDQTRNQIDEFLERLEDLPPDDPPQTKADRLNVTNFLIETVEALNQAGAFSTPKSKTKILTSLLTKKEQLEVELGIRTEALPELNKNEQQPVPVPEKSTPSPATEIVTSPKTDLPVKAVARTSLRERLWQILLSERTLQALLFLGIFLLFSAAISFVVWGWKDFSAPLRVAIPAGFTGMFFVMGWYVRTKTPMHRSGVALSAIAALLIPIDFYTVYINFNISPDFLPSFWLLTSVICLFAYIIATFIIRNQFFGYLVVTAAGSMVLAAIELGYQFFGLSLDWRSAGLSALSMGLIVLATILDKIKTNETMTVHIAESHRNRLVTISAQLFANPFRYISLLNISVIMLLTFGLRYLQRDTYDTLHHVLTINWWLGSFIFGWGAVFYKSRGLGLLAAFSLPVASYLTQASIFNQAGVSPAWHAFGWAMLVPFYFIVGFKLLDHKDDPIIYGYGLTAVGWGVALLNISAFWSLTNVENGTAPAVSHAVLAGSVVMAALLWQRPNLLFGASILAFSAGTFGMVEMDLTLEQMSVGWASLAIIHVLAAINVGIRFPIPIPNFAFPLTLAGYSIAAIAVVPPLLFYNGPVLAYTLANWIMLSVWAARLTHLKQPGFVGRNNWHKSIFHWLTSLPIPFWLWVLFALYYPIDGRLPLALAVLAWGLVAMSHHLTQIFPIYNKPWYVTGLLVSMTAVIALFTIGANGYLIGGTLLVVGGLYLIDAMARHQPLELATGGLVTAWGWLTLLDWSGLSFEQSSFGLALLVATYILTGLWIERKRSVVFTPQFLSPLYLTSHLLTAFVIWRVYFHSVDYILYGSSWTDGMRLWGAASQLLSGIVYGIFAWGRYKERWAHFAAWLGAFGGGFIAITFSSGSGSSAAKIAIGSILFILAERWIHRLRHRTTVSSRQQAFIRLTWRLYRRPLLVTGWTLSVAATGLALFRNLLYLDGGASQQIWASIALILIIGLYALSANLFRQARFAWFAAPLVFFPWTILTHLGWFTSYRPNLVEYALSWIVLALLLLGVSIYLNIKHLPSYELPVKLIAHLLLPFALLWSSVDVETSCFSVGLAIGFYAVSSLMDHWRWKSRKDPLAGFWKTKFFYPTSGLIPVWSLYLLTQIYPLAQPEHYGLLLLIFCPLGMVTGYGLYRLAVRPEDTKYYALPAYCIGYLSLASGTLLVVGEPVLLSIVLIYDAILLLISAWLFSKPIWVYPAALFFPVSLLLALYETNKPMSRAGWWLTGLATVYMLITWASRRVRLATYGKATLITGFVLIAVGLPPSSLDQTGMLWGYAGAALLLAVTAFWLHRPLLLTPASILSVVPYAVILQMSSLEPEFYGVALFPGAIALLGVGVALDNRRGAFCNFPWRKKRKWPTDLFNRLLNWWALPLYAVGFGLVTISPLFVQFKAELMALCFLLMLPIFGWAIYRFRLRFWLVAVAVAGHFAAVFLLEYFNWWHQPNLARAWIGFLPITLITAGFTVLISWYKNEPLLTGKKSNLPRWSYPLYIILLFDLITGQLLSLGGNGAAVSVTVVHILITITLASIWLSSRFAYMSLSLGVVAVLEGITAANRDIFDTPIVMAQLALLYGLSGYGIAQIRMRLNHNRELRSWIAIWELPLQRYGIGISLGTLVLSTFWGVDIFGWSMRALSGMPFKNMVDPKIVQMMIGTLGFLGLFYVTISITHRWVRLGYFSIGMLLTAWILRIFYIQQWDTFIYAQWYAIPIGLYILGISFSEWQQGNKAFARRIDYFAIILMLGTLFWQTLLFGWGYAILLASEGFAAMLWGSAHRLRRFLYVGMLAVMLATVGQLVNSFWSVNQWIVFGTIGLLLVLLAIVVERKLEDFRSWQKILDTWE